MTEPKTITCSQLNRAIAATQVVPGPPVTVTYSDGIDAELVTIGDGEPMLLVDDTPLTRRQEERRVAAEALRRLADAIERNDKLEVTGNLESRSWRPPSEDALRAWAASPGAYAEPRGEEVKQTLHLELT